LNKKKTTDNERFGAMSACRRRNTSRHCGKAATTLGGSSTEVLTMNSTNDTCFEFFDRYNRYTPIDTSKNLTLVSDFDS
jgi:hypothetical protein